MRITLAVSLPKMFNQNLIKSLYLNSSFHEILRLYNLVNQQGKNQTNLESRTFYNISCQVSLLSQTPRLKKGVRGE